MSLLPSVAPERRFHSGVAIGAFDPPHLGHCYLIDVARSQAEHLTVIVCDAAEQSIPGPLRMAWLRDLYPDVTVLCLDDSDQLDDPALWAARTVVALGSAPEAVFTSEEYGERYAGIMGSTHVMVDRTRMHIPISGTRVRADPLALWDYLPAPVRGYYCLRICAIGAESTGTTTLARALAAHYQTLWVPEYGRLYTQIKYRHGWASDSWTTDEFVHIAREQGRQEEAAARQANRVLILDTDAFATAIWHERYLGARDARVDAVAATYRPTLYLLTDDAIPFEQDSVRDGEHLRHWMQERFIAEMQREGRPFIVVSGTHEERLRAALVAIDALLPAAVPPAALP